MITQAVPTLRAAHIALYIEHFCSNEIQTERILQKFRLPTTVTEFPDMQIPLVQAVKLLSHIEKTEGLDAVSLFASEHITLKLLHPLTAQSILAAPALGAALEILTRKLPLESSVVEAWIMIGERGVRLLKRHRVALPDEQLRLMKIHFVLLFISVIRAFTGSGWMPKDIALRSSAESNNPFVSRRYPCMEVRFGQSVSCICIPKDMLGLTRVQTRGAGSNAPSSASLNVTVLTPTLDFVTSLKRVLRSYLAEGYPRVELAAEITRTSIRTLQRNLARSGLTYSKLVEQARLEAALEMLEQSSMKIIDIANAVGYEDPSHFSRAFRRMAGTTPRSFRLKGAA